jgi:hypothetical protein
VREQRLAQLAGVIATHLREWDPSPAYVDLAVFGTNDPHAIAEAVDAFCRRELGAGVARGRFHQSSVGSVTGVELEDGRCVVVKGHQPEHHVEWLREVVAVQRHLASRDLYATTVLAGPAPLERGQAIAEAFVDHGTMEDAHRPEIRRALATSLHDIVEACRPRAAKSSLKPSLLANVPPDRLWPTPHSKLFDLAAPVEWIDAIAIAARRRMVHAGQLVIGHGDWRIEHVRFASERPVVAFDWDSLCLEPEPALVGFTAHAFCADWTRPEEIAPAPTLDEARSFVAEYEAARGTTFRQRERQLCGAAFAYSCAYTARCGFSLGVDERNVAGTFMHLVATEALRLLEL